MSRELSRLYRALAADTDERALPAPDQLRRRADRRARNRAALGALTAAVLVAGTAAGTRMVLIAGPDAPPGPPAASPTDAGSPSPSPTASPSSPAPSRTTPPPSSRAPGPPPTSARPTATTPTSIPDRAFFTLPPANDVGTAGEFVPGPVLPELCGATPGEEQIAQRRARSLPYRLADAPPASVPDGYYRHSITVYRPGGADDALRALRRVVRDCPEQPVPEAPAVTSTQRLLDDSGYGDESVLFELRNPSLDVERRVSGEEVHLVRATRVGDVVTVLWEQGWEGSSTDRAQFDADSRRAVEAVRRWLG